MTYIVLDLEWNQGERRKKLPLTFEIIEIGAVKLNEQFQPVDEFHRIICPVIYPKLFSHTKKLIPLTEEDLQKGVPFKLACKEFLAWCKKEGDYIFATWGSIDLYELQRNMEFYKIKNPFSRPLYFLDIQKLYSFFLGEPSDCLFSLENAVSSLKLPLKEAFHSAKNDAHYTADVMVSLPKTLMKNYPSVDTFKFPIYKKQEVYLLYPDHSLYVSRAYKSKEALKLASSLRPLYCSICNKKVSQMSSWLPSGSKSFYMLGNCLSHGYLKAKRSIKNPSEKRFFETISIKPISTAEKERFIASYQTKVKKKSRL